MKYSSQDFSQKLHYECIACEKTEIEPLVLFASFFVFFGLLKMEFIQRRCKGFCILPKQHFKVKCLEFENKSIAVKPPDKMSSLHGNIALTWNVKWSKCSSQLPDLFFLNLYYQGAESICNEWIFNLLNLKKHVKVPCCNRVWEITCYYNYFLYPCIKIYM